MTDALMPGTARSMEDQIITLLASDDEGQSWFKLTEVDKADIRNY